jgi:hypothetical protein
VPSFVVGFFQYKRLGVLLNYALGMSLKSSLLISSTALPSKPLFNRKTSDLGDASDD